MPLIWTNQEELVTRVHNHPSRVPDDQSASATYVVSVPEIHDAATGQQLHYNEQNGFYYDN
jgi:hypothetical protein